MKIITRIHQYDVGTNIYHNTTPPIRVYALNVCDIITQRTLYKTKEIDMKRDYTYVELCRMRKSRVIKLAGYKNIKK